jgi:hypothetical protein
MDYNFLPRNYEYCAVLKRLAMPSDFHIPSPSIVPFAHSETSFTHGCTYPIFPGSSGMTSFFPSFSFPVAHNFWQSHWVHSHNMSIPSNYHKESSITSHCCIFPFFYYPTNQFGKQIYKSNQIGQNVLLNNLHALIWHQTT